VGTYMGIEIIESPFVVPVPKIQLRSDFTACTEGMRQRTNAWLLARFGTYTPVYVIGGSTMAVHPSHMAAIRAAALRNVGVIRNLE
jgi:hypothetical protein